MQEISYLEYDEYGNALQQTIDTYGWNEEKAFMDLDDMVKDLGAEAAIAECDIVDHKRIFNEYTDEKAQYQGNAMVTTSLRYADAAEAELINQNVTTTLLFDSKGNALDQVSETFVYDDTIGKLVLTSRNVMENHDYSNNGDAGTQRITSYQIEYQKDASGKTVVKGTQLPWGSPFGWYLMSFEPLVWQYGGSVFDEDQMSALDSAAVRNAFEVWNNIHNVYDTGSAPEFQGVSPVVDFANGKSAMVLGHMGSLGVLPEEIKQKTAFLPMPQVDPANPAGVLNAWGFFINRNSTIRDEATKWIDYFMRSAEQNPDITRGAFTPIKGYAQSDTVRQKVGYESATAGMAFSRPREGSQYYDETGAAIKKALEDVVLMGEDKEQVIKALHEQVNKIQSGN